MMDQSKKTRVGIIGLGPVGIMLAVYLQEAGCEVGIYDKDRLKINQIRNEGLRLAGKESRQTSFKNIFTSMEEMRDFDPTFLLFSLKTYQLAAMVKSTFDLLGEKAKEVIVVSAQNGIDTEKILSDVFGESRTLRMVINFAGNLTAPNVVNTTFFNPPNYLASVDDSKTKEAQLLASYLDKVGITTTVIDSYELIRRTWEKTILNSSLSAICGVGRVTMQEAMEMPDTLEIIEQIIRESIEVAAAEKIFFEDDFVRKCMRYLRKAGNHFPSLAVDVINNRETEIDYLNGKIVEYGKKHYIRASLNLVYTNTVKAMTQKAMMNQLSTQGLPNGMNGKKELARSGKVNDLKPVGDCFVGIDLGSAYTKLTVIDSADNVVYRSALKNMNRDRLSLRHVLEAIRGEFPVRYQCATGYGRKTFAEAEMAKTEINCAAAGVSKYFSGAKNIIDIGGEDIKIIKCDNENNVETFYLNDKCAAGTGSFLSEISEKAGIPVQDMSVLAEKSINKQELNSFCTVFAKTEIMKWMFDGMPVEDIAKGIYLSIINRVTKLRIDPALPVFMIGGVVAHHYYFKTLLEEKFKKQVVIVEAPQFVVSLGAALMAKEQFTALEASRKKESVLKT